MSHPHHIQALLRAADISPDAYADLVYAVGAQFLQEMEGHNPPFLAYLERSKLFWSWWHTQFEALSLEFYHRYADQLPHLRAHYVSKRYRDYVTIVKISAGGIESYVQMLKVANSSMTTTISSSSSSNHASDGSKD